MKKLTSLFILLVLVCLPLPAQDRARRAPIAAAAGGGPAVVGNTTEAFDSTDPDTFTADATGGTYMLMGTHHDDASLNVVGATFNSDAFTLIDVENPPGSFGRTEAWGLASPDQGSFTESINFNAASGHFANVVWISGATSLGTPVSANGTGTDATATCTSAAGQLVVAFLTVSLNGSETATATGTPIYNQIQANTIRGAAQTKPGAASVVMNWTLSGSLDWTVICVAVVP